MSDEEREFRLRPGKARIAKQSHGGVAWSPGFKMLMHYARQSRKGTGQNSGVGRRSFSHRQRCAVRITYAKNSTRGQWAAHGRYLERDSALGGGTGFDVEEAGVSMSGRLQDWQANKDELLWKFIISPEFGDRADLQKLTRDLMARVGEGLGGTLEWVAVVHRNTEHPHVHVAVRGIEANGATLRLSRNYIKSGVQDVAEELCTRQMGFRTSLDAADAERREINEMRFTSLDRSIVRGAQIDEKGLVFAQSRETSRARNHNVAARLLVLARMGLAECGGKDEWRLRTDMEQVLRAMQRSADRQKMLAAHGELVSDKRLQIEVADWRRWERIEGRVLVHGEDDNSGKRYLMLEATVGRVFYIPYSPDMEQIRSSGGLKTNSFIRLQRRFDSGRRRIEIEDYGSAEAVLTNPRLLREKANELREQGIESTEVGWEGWLGRYQKAICDVQEDKSVENINQLFGKQTRRPESSSRGR